MIGWIAIALGLVTAASTSALHPRLHLHPWIVLGAGLIGGWAGSHLLAGPWLPLVNDIDAAASLAGGATGGILAAAIAIVASATLGRRQAQG